MEPSQLGSELVSIGIIFFLFSIVLMLVGYLWRSVEEQPGSLPYVDSGESPLPRYTVTPLRLRSDARIDGKIVGKKGSFQFSIQDYFGGLPSLELGYRWWFSSYVYKVMESGGEENFAVLLKPGDYVFLFTTESKIAEGTVEYTITKYKKPLRKLIDVGLVIFQVAIPILVTGLVLFSGFSPI